MIICLKSTLDKSVTNIQSVHDFFYALMLHFFEENPVICSSCRGEPESVDRRQIGAKGASTYIYPACLMLLIIQMLECSPDLLEKSLL